MAKIRFVFDRNREYRKVVNGWKASLSDFMWFWPAATREVARTHERLFDTQGSSGVNGRWTDLAYATRRFRERRVGYYGSEVPNAGVGPEGPVLHWTYRLRDSLGDFHDQGTVMSVRRYFRKKMVYGTKHPVAHLNHRGIDAPKRELLDEEGSADAAARLMQKVLPNLMRTHRSRGRFRRLR